MQLESGLLLTETFCKGLAVENIWTVVSGPLALMFAAACSPYGRRAYAFVEKPLTSVLIGITGFACGVSWLRLEAISTFGGIATKLPGMTPEIFAEAMREIDASLPPNVALAATALLLAHLMIVIVFNIRAPEKRA